MSEQEQLTNRQGKLPKYSFKYQNIRADVFENTNKKQDGTEFTTNSTTIYKLIKTGDNFTRAKNFRDSELLAVSAVAKMVSDKLNSEEKK